MHLSSYPYRFVQRVDDADCQTLPYLQYKLLYTFKSPVSHQWYWVWVEVYDNDFYAVKFHLKAHRDSANKYSIMTGFNEARPVICTCIAIMDEIAHINPRSSFGFIGASMKEESSFMTKRFRIYSLFMATYFAETVFEHRMMMDKSAYLLVRKSELEKTPELLSTLSQKFNQMYDYFD